VMAPRCNPGLTALADAAKLGRRRDAWPRGGLLGARLNAAGRVGRAGIAARRRASADPAGGAHEVAPLETPPAGRRGRPAVARARRAGPPMAGGGHPMAAGVTGASDRIAELHAFFDGHVRQAARGAPLPQDSVPLLVCDGTLAPSGATADLVALVEKLGP